MQQISLDYFKPHFVIDKPVRLIELFAGIGSQAKALENLGVDFEKYIISEWDVEATRSYKAIHFAGDNYDYCADLPQRQIIDELFKLGISADGKEPLNLKQIARHNEKWLKRVYNNFKATNNIGSITNATAENLQITDTDKYTYILTYSFPCQDLSTAGKGLGMSEGGQTRSGLLWEVKRLLSECSDLPQVLLMENVPQVHANKHLADFNKWIDFLCSCGYSNYYADLNAKDYGVPQNRNRTFMISILGDYFYEFPEEVKLTHNLKDYLEKEVDKKFYLSSKGIDFITKPMRLKKKYTSINPDIALPLTAKGIQNWTGSFVSEVIGSKQKHAFRGSLDGVCPTLTTAMGEGGGQIPMIKEPVELGDSIDINFPNSETRKGRHQKGLAHTIKCQNNSQVVIDEPFIVASRGRNPENPSDRRAGIPLKQILESRNDGLFNCLTTVQKDNLVAIPNPKIIQIGQIYPNSGNPQAGRIYLSKGISPALDTSQGGNRMPKVVSETDKISIRKLTPKECLRLMTFSDSDYEAIKAAGVSDTQIYKQAGNSIVVKVMEHIFSILFEIEVKPYVINNS